MYFPETSSCSMRGITCKRHKLMTKLLMKLTFASGPTIKVISKTTTKTCNYLLNEILGLTITFISIVDEVVDAAIVIRKIQSLEFDL